MANNYEKIFFSRIRKLIWKMTKNYQKAQVEKQIKDGINVFRGRMKPNSSLFEESMALIFHDILENGVSIYIDQAISFAIPGETRKKDILSRYNDN